MSSITDCCDKFTKVVSDAPRQLFTAVFCYCLINRFPCFKLFLAICQFIVAAKSFHISMQLPDTVQDYPYNM